MLRLSNRNQWILSLLIVTLIILKAGIVSAETWERIITPEDGISSNATAPKFPLNFRRISSSFTKSRLHPIRKIRNAHKGMDYAASKGTPVLAMADGQILTACHQRGYGKFVVILHREGYKTLYSHLSKIAREVKKGANVIQGQIIGFVGSTGLSTGPHLHFETRLNNRPINPLKANIPTGKTVPEAPAAPQPKEATETGRPLIIEMKDNVYVRIQ